jgi:hypothetical protein
MSVIDTVTTYREGYIVHVYLTPNELETMQLMLGMATGAAIECRGRKLAMSFIRLANKLNEGNKNWIPYEVEDEKG